VRNNGVQRVLACNKNLRQSSKHYFAPRADLRDKYVRCKGALLSKKQVGAYVQVDPELDDDDMQL
jgi:hypothetical protein